MKPLNLTDELPLDIVLVNGNPYMFSNMRIDRGSIPVGLYAYGVRDDDDCSGTFANIKEHVLVNHWGDIIGKEPLPLDDLGTYWCVEEDGQFLDVRVGSVGEYLQRYEELKSM